MLQIIFAFICLGIAGVILFRMIASFLPEWIRDEIATGFGCFFALVGLAIIVVPVILLILWLIGTFCD